MLTAALLAWKEPLAGFSKVLTEEELRSAVLLAILAFVIYPGLPEGTVDPWGLLEPRAAWVTVLLIAGIGFANYVLLKLYGPRAVELTGFFGGLVNSTVAVTELAARVREQPALASVAYRGVLLATAAMALRNAAVLGALAPRALLAAGPAFGLMVATGLGLAALRGPEGAAPAEATALSLKSSFALSSALRFGALFLAFGAAGALAQQLQEAPAVQDREQHVQQDQVRGQPVAQEVQPLLPVGGQLGLVARAAQQGTEPLTRSRRPPPPG